MLTSRQSLVNIVSQFPNLSLTYALLTVGTQYWTSNLLVSCAQRSHNIHSSSIYNSDLSLRRQASPSPQMQVYQYSPLASGDIRRFILFPGGFDDPLQGQIVHDKVTFEDEYEAYEALSYVWGDQDDPETLTVLAHTIWGLLDDEELYEIGSLRIGQNLASALRHLRHKTDFRALWCDAVCINQNDLDERATQVLRMGYIYQYAARVVVWLGPGDEDTSGAIQTLSTMGSPWRWTEEDGLMLKDGRDEDYYWHEAEDGALTFSPIYCETVLKADWQPLLHLLRLPWFSRLWVRQEIGLANESAIFVLGYQEIRWSILGDALLFILMFIIERQPPLDQFAKHQIQKYIINATDIVYSSRIPDQRSLPSLLLSTNRCKCSDQRDRIYGIAGFQPAFCIQPDYEKSVRQVYADAFRGLAEGGSCQLLSWCDMADSPSWAPDFTRPVPKLLSAVDQQVSGPSEAVFAFLPDLSARTVGVYCDTVASCLPPIPEAADGGVLQAVIQSWINRILFRDMHNYNTAMVDDLVSTITLGKVQEYYEDSRWTLRQVQNVFLRNVKGYNADESVSEEHVASQLDRWCELILPGSVLHETQEGFFALGNEATRPGDRIFAILGCPDLIILRPVVDQQVWRVVGSCFMHSRVRMEAVLGDLPAGWQMKYASKHWYYSFTRPDGTSTPEDPRLEPLPAGWVHYYDERVGLPVWENPEGVKTSYDFRLSPERLRARGVELEELILV
ncbi:hypothetical protein CkaCkLH20_10950 [Colletotrichum karsti]|uniref:Heterokaryon incompatibility domain-containing protein n=1 Tax=Colletotrichum karsti TaxID=1095194 RepID=A0A9P6HWA2_9PEZI|nr:uncharacterized protein CkaCkLH20_10950 [Colletotrichum karsti]KAF9871539.1 hypothetical protein CkaCkLH20_10950 [Colletotrichum karsti]